MHSEPLTALGHDNSMAVRFGQFNEVMRDRRLRVLLIAELDPRIGWLRRGPQLRVRHRPRGVRYYLPGELSKLYVVPPSYERPSVAEITRYVFRQAARLMRPALGKGFDLVHTFFVDLTRFSAPCVHESDQSIGQYLEGYLSLDGVSERLLRPLTEVLVERCPAVVTWSSWAAKGFVVDGIEYSRIHVVPPPMGLGEQRPHRGVNLLIVGRDPYRKGLDLALKAFERASRGADGIARMYVVGPGNAVGERRGIVTLDRVTEEYLYNELLPRTDVVLAPSRAEAYNLTVLEAMAHGAVPVVSRVGGLPELVSDAGFVIEPDDVDSLADVVEELISDGALRAKLSSRAQELISVRHDPERVGESLLKVYNRAVEEGS